MGVVAPLAQELAIPSVNYRFVIPGAAAGGGKGSQDLL